MAGPPINFALRWGMFARLLEGEASTREIADAAGVASWTAHPILKNWMRRGAVRRVRLAYRKRKTGDIWALNPPASERALTSQKGAFEGHADSRRPTTQSHNL